MYQTLVYCALAVIWFVLGYVCGRSCRKEKICGNLVTNTTDPKKDFLRFELDCSIGELTSSKTVTFKVVNEDSQ